MKKPVTDIFITAALLLAIFTIGFFLGQNRDSGPLEVHLSDTFMTSPRLPEEASLPDPVSGTEPGAAYPVNINTATKEALMTLPGIGETYALRIIRYRETYGPFGHTEELLKVEGIGEKRLEAILELITIGGPK